MHNRRRREAVAQTDRLLLRWAEPGDAPFVLELVNDPDWKTYIGDRNVRTLEDALQYVNKIGAAYERTGLGLYVVERKLDRTPAGLCGLLQRGELPDVDIGFAFLPAFRGIGYAYESAVAVLAYGRARFGLERVAAITVAHNARSIALLEKLGMSYERTLRLTPNDPEVRLYARSLK